ncbi:hypothetical protein WJX75_006996 [Coccomyxa subellipsoidea]|uniref:Uncharacterized protein n=1 Tax=Coccomyxa subellipsoidea TaxID=248742 RepID=A0ABR2YRN6_9CHLO
MKSTTAILTVLSLIAVASGQQAPAPAGAEDAIVSILDASGAPVAAVPVSDGSILKVSSGGVTVLKPDGQAQAVLGLTHGHSTIWVQPSSATSKGTFTISQASFPNIKVSLAPALAGSPLPGATSDMLREVADYRLIG